MSNTTPPAKVLYADPEHGGVRFIVLLVIFGGMLLSFLLLRPLIGGLTAGTGLNDFTTLLACVGAIPLSMGIAYAAEHYLKRTWRSGLSFTLNEDTLHFEAEATETYEAQDITIDWSRRVNLTRWNFRLANYPRAGRERMVSDKWECLACQIQQDESRLICFAYYPPDEALELTEQNRLSEPFYEISLAMLYREAGTRRWNATTRPEIPSEMLTGEAGRYWIAERRRWQEGLELSKVDFATLTTYIETHI